MDMRQLPLRAQALGNILRTQAERLGSRPFVRFGGQVLSYAQANAQANRVAHGLASIGVTRGTRVGILVDNCPEYISLWFGLGKLAAVEVPLNTQYRSRQMQHVLGEAQVEVLVLQPRYLDAVLPVLPSLPKLRALVFLEAAAPLPAPDRDRALAVYRWPELMGSASGHEPAVEVTGRDVIAIMHTSGTTGPSKGVVLPHAQQYVLARNIANDLDLTESDVYYCFFPLFHNTAQAMIALPVLLTGAQMVLRDRFSASSFWPDVDAHRCTVFYYIGEILNILLKTTPEEHRRSTLRSAWGIAARPADFTEFQRRFGVVLRGGYGSTEANVPCYLPHDDPRPGSAGRVLPGWEVRVVDEFDQPRPPGQVGEIVVRSYEPFSMFLGYDGRPDATCEAWRNLWFHTGDAGYFDEEGNLFFVDRLKDVIRVRGENISSFDIEVVVNEFSGVLESAAIAVPSELGGDDVKVAVVPQPGRSIDIEALIAHCERLLPRYAVPRYVEVVESLPKTETNKIRKHVLRENAFNSTTWDRQRKAFLSEARVS